MKSSLTDAEKRSKWFCGGTSVHEAGGEVQFVFNNSQLGFPRQPTPEKYKEFGDGFISKAIVIEAEKPRLLVIEWDGVVRFELEEQGDKVKLVLTHDMKDAKDTRTGAAAGWHTHLGILSDSLHGKTSKSFWTVHMAMEEEYAAIL